MTVADLADLVCLSPSAFAHLFRDDTGMSPYQFIKGVRMERARELLVAGEMNVSAIARTPCSYADSQRGVVPLRMDLSAGLVQG